MAHVAASTQLQLEKFVGVVKRLSREARGDEMQGA